MDRDQVNCLHYLYQYPLGRPRRLTFGEIAGPPPLVWCQSDTVSPLVQSGLLGQDSLGIITPDWCINFIDQIEGQLRSLPKPDFIFGYPFSAPIRKLGDPRPAFVAISYDPLFAPIKGSIVAAGAQKNFRCEVTGDLASPGNIMDQVWQGIRGADIVVADITGSNPNVMIEVGIAAALGKEVVVISQNNNLPFDIAHWRKFEYDPLDLSALEKKLVTAFDAVSARYPFGGPEPRF